MVLQHCLEAAHGQYDHWQAQVAVAVAVKTNAAAACHFALESSRTMPLVHITL